MAFMSTFGNQSRAPARPPTVVAGSGRRQKGLGGAVAIPQLLGYLAVAILLALPPANAFFSQATPVWQPPTT
jgi:hypothetical protein